MEFPVERDWSLISANYLAVSVERAQDRSLLWSTIAMSPFQLVDSLACVTNYQGVRVQFIIFQRPVQKWKDWFVVFNPWDAWKTLYSLLRKGGKYLAGSPKSTGIPNTERQESLEGSVAMIKLWDSIRAKPKITLRFKLLQSLQSKGRNWKS